MAISVSFPFSKVAQPEARGPALCWLLAFSTSSCLQTLLIPKLNRGSPGPLLPSVVFLYHIFSPNWSGLQTNWLPVFTELYDSSTSTQSLMHFRRLWNGMFDRHRAEITVMQFTGHSLPVDQFVTVPWDFNPVPYCQPSSPTPMEYALPPSLEWHVRRGQRSIYNTKEISW